VHQNSVVSLPYRKTGVSIIMGRTPSHPAATIALRSQFTRDMFSRNAVCVLHVPSLQMLTMATHALKKASFRGNNRSTSERFLVAATVSRRPFLLAVRAF
jgi:hypothetical protein